MPWYHFLWTDEIVAHLAENGVSQDDFEHVVMNPIGAPGATPRVDQQRLGTHLMAATSLPSMRTWMG
jgi:hypothetical protein